MHLLRITTIFYRTLGIIIITIKITNSLMSPTVQSIVKFPLLSLQKSHIVLKKLIRGVGGRERNMDLLLHLFMHSLVDSCRCPDQGLNPQPWHIRTTLSPTELPRQGPYLFLEIQDPTNVLHITVSCWVSLVYSNLGQILAFFSLMTLTSLKQEPPHFKTSIYLLLSSPFPLSTI